MGRSWYAASMHEEIKSNGSPSTSSRKRKLQDLAQEDVAAAPVKMPALQSGHSESSISSSEDQNKGTKKARKADKKARKLSKQMKRARLEANEAKAGPITTNGTATSNQVESPLPRRIPETKIKQSHKLKMSRVRDPSKYTEHPALAALPKEKISSFLRENHVTIDEPTGNSLRPIVGFEYLSLHNEDCRKVFKGFSVPTPIQAAGWPFLLAGKDVIGVAETGSGKTLAFGIPCIEFLASSTHTENKTKGVKAVIVSPTRELALQIFEEFQKLIAATKYKAACIYGGVAKDDQRDALSTAQIIVATPGRLYDFIQEGSADLSNVEYLVLDEADRMLDKGFEEDVRKIITATKPMGRQTLMFTATWPDSVKKLAATFLQSPVRITIGDNPTGELRANTSIEQRVEVVDPEGKQQRLVQLLKQHQSGKKSSDRILVFCLYKKEAARIESFVRAKGFKVGGIHGDMGQMQRSASLDAFRQGKVPLLVATDVAARGLDIPAVKLVINLTFPLTVEDYVHRIGRTGRAGKSGIAVTLFTEHDKAQSGALINVLKAAKQPVPEELLKFGTTVKKKSHDAYGAFYREPVANLKASKITFD